DAVPTPGRGGRQMSTVVASAPLWGGVPLNPARWVADGVEPPASAVPRLADGTGVQAEQTRRQFARIPGVRFPDRIERPRRLDFGPGGRRGLIHGAPPTTGNAHESFGPSG